MPKICRKKASLLRIRPDGGEQDSGGMPVHRPRRVLQFDAFILDPARCTLHRGHDEVLLRPKSFDVLRYLAAHAGRIVTKDEIFAAVWAGLSVTDDSLVQCVMDIRKALGDRGQTIIKSVPRRGYRMDATVSEIDLPGDPRALAPGSVDGHGQNQHSMANLFALGSWRRGGHAAFAFGVLILLGCTIVASGVFRQPMPMNAHAVHHTTLATAAFEKERTPRSYREAFALYAKALDIDPDFVPALIGYAQVIIVGATEHWAPPREQEMRLNLAEAAIERANGLEPRNPRALRVKGFLLRARGQPDRAIAALERARALIPNDPWVHADLGRARIEAGQALEAIEDLKTAMRLSPNDPLIYIWYYQAGMAAVHAQQSHIALEWLQKSEQANSAYLQHVTFWRAVASADAGFTEEGRWLMARYIANAPTFTVAAWNEHFPRRNAMVAVQRARIANVLNGLGLPAGEAKIIGSRD